MLEINQCNRLKVSCILLRDHHYALPEFYIQAIITLDVMICFFVHE